MKIIYKIFAVIMFLTSLFFLIGTISLLSTIGGAIVFGVLTIASLIVGIKLWKLSKPKKTTDSIQQNIKQTIPDGELNYNLFEDIVDENVLLYKYENNLFVQNFEPIVGNGGQSIRLIPEPDNEYDKETIAAYLNGEKIAYIYKSKIRDMIHDWQKRNWKICAYINKYNMTEKTATYKIGFYKPLDMFENHEYRLTKISKKADEYGISRYDNISCLSEGDVVSIFDLTVYDDNTDEIGELPKSAEDFINSCEETAAIISEIYEDYDKISAKITVYKIK